jgi:peptidoglycan-associated lipoprotein
MTRKIIAAFAILLAVGACSKITDPDKRKGAGDTKDRVDANRPSPKASWNEYTNKEKRGYSDRVFFETDRHDLDANARATIEAWARWMKAHGGASMLVEGHADERGTREYNLALGARRATSVRNYLIALGVQARQLRTISYGKERPAVAGSNEGAWKENRRGVAKPTGGGS